jgi:hypothetical protein
VPSKERSCPFFAKKQVSCHNFWMESPFWTLLLLKVLMPWALGFFTYLSIKEHFTSIVGLEGNRSYNHQSLQLRNIGFWVWGGSATANPSKISLSQFWTMSTFHMARALLTEIVFLGKICFPIYFIHSPTSTKIFKKSWPKTKPQLHDRKW